MVKNRLDIKIINDDTIVKFKHMVQNLDWTSTLLLNANKAYDEFIEKINMCYNETIPLKRMTIRQHNNKPWITENLKKLIKKKNKLYKLYNISKDTLIKQKYTILKKQLIISIKESKDTY